MKKSQLRKAIKDKKIIFLPLGLIFDWISNLVILLLIMNRLFNIITLLALLMLPQYGLTQNDGPRNRAFEKAEKKKEKQKLYLRLITMS